MSSAYSFGEGGTNSLSHGVRKCMEDAAKSKTGLWGPSHSFDSDDTSNPEDSLLLQHSLGGSAKQQHAAPSKGGTHTTKSDTASSADSPTQRGHPVSLVQTMTLERIFESASAAVDSLVKTATGSAKNESSPTKTPRAADASTTGGDLKTPDITTTFSAFELFVEETCTSPCTSRHLSQSPPRRAMQPVNEDQSLHGTIPLVSSPTKSVVIPVANNTRVVSEMSVDTPLDWNRGRQSQRVHDAPVSSFTVQQTLERSISELTMKSSYGEATSKLGESRRMAYYAVGKHHKNSGHGGNRRCYFTGKLILGGAPFYAGSVEQGLRTLVVFCLPSAVGLPKEGVDHLFAKQRSDMTGSNTSSQGVLPLPRAVNLSAMNLKRVPTKGSASISKGTSMDDMSFLEEELDPNWDIDRDYLLQVLPEPSKDLLDEMAVRYPDQFETLPVQVRSPHCWRLFIKFCFFSGLPIAEGEMHYKVIDEVANEVYGEEIILSHEVMEAVNGESAEILRLPNLKTFTYLRKHYTQQSGKLSDAVFRRTSWEMVRPEI
jgi:hypothetical protein